MQTEKVCLTREKATLLITLYSKAQESELPDSLLHDHFAARAVDRIDYDFPGLGLGRDEVIGMALRAHVFDGWTREFLDAHPDATVLHLGCGLDSRVFRIQPPAGVHWFDVDYPEVVALRRRIYPRPRAAGYMLVGSPVTQPDWLARVPGDRPTLILAEGLLPYLAHDDVPRLLQRLTAHAPSGELAFDGYNRLGVEFLRHYPPIRAMGAAPQWSLDDPRELEAVVPRLRLLTEMTTYDPAQTARMSWATRMMLPFFTAVPVLRRLGRLLRYRF